VTPSEALHKASNILVDHFTKIGDLSENAADTEEKSTEKEEGVENEE
jgi:DNA-directed RNA polymerase alpha subunit